MSGLKTSRSFDDSVICLRIQCEVFRKWVVKITIKLTDLYFGRMLDLTKQRHDNNTEDVAIIVQSCKHAIPLGDLFLITMNTVDAIYSETSPWLHF